MQQFEKSSECEYRLVFRSPACAAVDPKVYRAGFGILRRTDGGTHRSPRGAGGRGACAGASRSRVSGGAVEGSTRITVSDHLRIFGRGVPCRDSRALQAATSAKEANQALEPTTT